MTSHDVVGRVRRLAGLRRVGHAGTLDPMATGVLVVCLGQATRVAEYLAGHDKAYRATLRLGQTTDTYDADGRLVAEHAGPLPVRPAFEAVLAGFRGAIMQQPPAYSAIKQGGQPLYRRARRGEQVETPARQVTISRLELVDWEPPLAVIDVECSAGTYVRSIAHDLGQALAVGAHLAALRRTRSGYFDVALARPLEELEAAPAGAWRRRLLPPEAALLDWPVLQLTDEEAQRVAYGQALAAPAGDAASLARAHGPDGRLLALLEYEPAEALWQPRKVFV